MSIWICDPATRHRTALAMAMAVLVLLPACLGGLGAGDAPESAKVTRGEVVIAGPRGYCIDKSARRDGPDGTFLLLASCAALSRTPDAPFPPIPGVLSAMVSAQADGANLGASLGEIEQFLSSPAGRAALGRSGNADAVQVLQSRIARGVLLLHIRDEGAFDGPAIESDYWRAIFSVRDHIVTLSAMAPAGQSGNGSLDTLEGFIARVQRENATSAASAPVSGNRQAPWFAPWRQTRDGQ